MAQDCPRCGSAKIVVIESNYPLAFECRRCGLVFSKSTNSLVDG